MPIQSKIGLKSVCLFIHLTHFIFRVILKYPTLFLVYLTDDAMLDVALCRAYNRFVANACAKAPDRLKWVVILPLRDIAASLAEMKWAKEQGAVGVFFRGMEGNLTLDNP